MLSAAMLVLVALQAPRPEGSGPTFAYLDELTSIQRELELQILAAGFPDRVSLMDVRWSEVEESSITPELALYHASRKARFLAHAEQAFEDRTVPLLSSPHTRVMPCLAVRRCAGALELVRGVEGVQRCLASSREADVTLSPSLYRMLAAGLYWPVWASGEVIGLSERVVVGDDGVVEVHGRESSVRHGIWTNPGFVREMRARFQDGHLLVIEVDDISGEVASHGDSSSTRRLIRSWFDKTYRTSYLNGYPMPDLMTGGGESHLIELSADCAEDNLHWWCSAADHVIQHATASQAGITFSIVQRQDRDHAGGMLRGILLGDQDCLLFVHPFDSLELLARVRAIEGKPLSASDVATALLGCRPDLVGTEDLLATQVPSSSEGADSLRFDVGGAFAFPGWGRPQAIVVRVQDGYRIFLTFHYV